MNEMKTSNLLSTVLILICHKLEFSMYNTFQAILEKLLAKSEVRVITIQLHNYNNGFDNKF